MPLPFIIAGLAVAAGVSGVGVGVSGAVKMNKAKNSMKLAQERNKENEERLKHDHESCSFVMDYLGKLEMEIGSSFRKFSNIFEKIKNAPKFKEINMDMKISIPTLDELKEHSVAADIVLGSLGGAGAGVAGGIAAAGGTSAAVMAVGTASTGTAISTLSGAAATNATLAALGGGSLAAGGGGMALGAAVLGTTTLGVGLLFGGIVLNAIGSKKSSKAEKAWKITTENEKKRILISQHLLKLKDLAESYSNSLEEVYYNYDEYLSELEKLVERENNYKNFSNSEKLILGNTVLLVRLLHEMCKVKFLNGSPKEDELQEINTDEINKKLKKADDTLLYLEE